MTYILIIPGLPALAWLIVGALWLRREWIEIRLRYAVMFPRMPTSRGPLV